MEKQTEMSLDDVLSSIKQMVIDEEPPVLELTERVSDDGSIITLEDAAQPAEDSNGMSAFLKMAQSTVIPDSPVKDVAVEMTPISDSSEQGCNDKKDVLRGLILSVAEPIIREWLSNNLESITRSIVEEKVKKALEK
jgi:cell pole-organizing protein PopZ